MATSITRQVFVTRMTDAEISCVGSRAIIVIHPPTGHVIVSCMDHETLQGQHTWASRGDLSLKDFLCTLDRPYVIEKLFDKHRLMDVDWRVTMRACYGSIITARRNRNLTREEARSLWDDLASTESIDDLHRVYHPATGGMSDHVVWVEKPCVAWFWDEVWTPFILTLRSEVRQ